MNLEVHIYTEPPTEFAPKVEVAASYIRVGRKLLFMERAGNDESGFWGVPGGKIEADEHPLKGAQRELLEETGIDLPLAAFRVLGKLFIRKPTIDYVYHLFGIDLLDYPKVILSHEHAAFAWVDKEELEKLNLMKGALSLQTFYETFNQ